MKTALTVEQKTDLEKRHRVERDGRVRDRIKAVLLKSEGWTNEAIAQALRIHADTVSEHIRDWLSEQKLKPSNGGSFSKLSAEQTKKLERHLIEKCYTKVRDICQIVTQSFGIHYTVSGMTKWLKGHGFRYKQPKARPAKLDPQKQAEFIDYYFTLLEELPASEPIVFMDASHPTMATKISHGWIKKGMDKPIAQTASRTRVNIIGAIELQPSKIHSAIVDMVNTETTLNFFDQLKSAYPQASKIHVILDQAGYNRSQQLQEKTQAKGIILHYLPPYSPNLNPIERLWKLMNEYVRNNVCFKSAVSFRDAIATFFNKTIFDIKQVIRSRINDDFQIIHPVASG